MSDETLERIAQALETLDATLSSRLGDIESELRSMAVCLDRIDDGVTFVGTMISQLGPPEPEDE